MSDDTIEYTTPEPFAGPAAGTSQVPPRIFGSPARYVQGDGVIDRAGHYLSRLGFRRSAILLSQRSREAEGGRVLASARAAGLAMEILTFEGECSLEEIGRHTSALRALPEPVDGVIAVGGGKVVDAGRAIARRLDLAVAVVPSLASNDAPCSAGSVMKVAGWLSPMRSPRDTRLSIGFTGTSCTVRWWPWVCWRS